MDVVRIDSRFFNPERTLFCGQCFRAEKNGDNSYTQVAFGKVITLTQTPQEVLLDCGKEDFQRVWKPYFGLDLDYESICGTLSADPHLARAIRRFAGLRLLKQEFFETYISFIISSNNNINRIGGIIRRLCEKYGQKISCGGKTYHAFPKAEVMSELTADRLESDLSVGYRGAYIADGVRKYCSGEIDETQLAGMGYQAARSKLMTVQGIGPKVADCICLFSLGFYEAFPLDVWMKRVMERRYGLTGSRAAEYAQKTFGPHAGIAQQYLFFWERDVGNDGCGEESVV